MGCGVTRGDDAGESISPLGACSPRSASPLSEEKEALKPSEKARLRSRFESLFACSRSRRPPTSWTTCDTSAETVATLALLSVGGDGNSNARQAETPILATIFSPPPLSVSHGALTADQRLPTLPPSRLRGGCGGVWGVGVGGCIMPPPSRDGHGSVLLDKSDFDADTLLLPARIGQHPVGARSEHEIQLVWRAQRGGKGTDGSVLGDVDALVHRERPEAFSSSLFLSRVRSWSCAAADPFSEGLSANICTHTPQKKKYNRSLRSCAAWPHVTALSETTSFCLRSRDACMPAKTRGSNLGDMRQAGLEIMLARTGSSTIQITQSRQVVC